MNKNINRRELDVMNFLNEISIEFPDAISFGSGRPTELFFQMSRWINGIERLIDVPDYEPKGLDWSSIGQYGYTNGYINGAICELLKNDEDMLVTPDKVIVSAGAQESMAMCMLGLFNVATDVLIVIEPTYIGITGLAIIQGIEICAIGSGSSGVSFDDLFAAVEDIRQRGKVPRAIYVVPDYSNPLGVSMSLDARQTLLAFCTDHQILILEDNPYGMFRYRGDKLPTLLALDQNAPAIYLGTFSKTLCPGLRTGYLVCSDNMSKAKVPEKLSRVKSLLTVNTSPILQAIVGSILYENKYSLTSLVKPAVDYYKGNNEAMLISLDRYFPPADSPVSWNRPMGGFFISVTLPFAFEDSDLYCCAKEYGVIVTPMSFFTVTGSGQYDNQVRLSFSYVKTEEIDEGVKRFSEFIRRRI